MELDRDERLVEARGLHSPFVVLAVLFLVMAVVTLPVSGQYPLALLAMAVLILGACATIVWHAKHVIVTDRRLVEYRVLLARLARRYPRFAPWEAHRRVVTPLEAVTSARRSDDLLVLTLRDGAERRLVCRDEDTAARMLLTIQAQMKHAIWLREEHEARLALALQVSAVPVPGAGRCPYCHDAVAAGDAATCERCGVEQHHECMQIHGGCAAMGCSAREKRRVRD